MRMSEPFDPYYRWLSIPPTEQPPNHYRLLGLALFENNADVIDLAADRQMLQLRQMQSGPHAADSQRLLNEVAAARACLVDPGRRQAYDAVLRREMERQNQEVALPAPGFATGPPLLADFAAPAPFEPPFPSALVSAGPPRSVLLDRSRAARPNAALWLVPAAAALVVLLTRDGASILVGGGDGALTAWSAPGLEPEARIAAHRAAVSALALTHRGDTLLTASADGAVRLWQLRAAPHR
jgi:hypothetical protein